MKTIKKIFLRLLVFISLCIFSTKVSANTINSIEMDVYIDLNGNAQITEIWNTYLNEGTEGYRPYTKLGNSTISNFSVTDETGIIYENLSNWNTSASFYEKAYKSGINHIPNGLELCWGISEYGNKTYTLKYKINNFVTQYTDTQGIYFNFLNLKQYIGNAKITIHSDYSFSLDNARIWAFGNKGTINFENGNIVLNSNRSLNEEQYMTVLVRFEKNLFDTSNISPMSFDDAYDSAMKEIIKWHNIIIVFIAIIIAIVILIIVKMKIKNYNKKNKASEATKIRKKIIFPALKHIFVSMSLIILVLHVPVILWVFIIEKFKGKEQIIFVFFAIISVVIIYLSHKLLKKIIGAPHNNLYEKNNLSKFRKEAYVLIFFLILLDPAFLLIVLYFIITKKDISIKISRNDNNNLDFGEYGRTLPYDNKIDYFRDIPCNKDLQRAYWVALQYNVVSASTLYKGIIGAILLKWIKEEKIAVKNTKQISADFKDNNYAIDIGNALDMPNQIENNLLEILKKASGDNGLLEVREFTNWCYIHHREIQNWFSSFDIIEEKSLEEQGLITPEKQMSTGLLGNKVQNLMKKVNPKLREDAIQLKGLKKFLLEFSRMPESNYYEVHIWEEYLIFATLLGIADRVEEQFSRLYPNFKEESKLGLYEVTQVTTYISNVTYNTYENSRIKQENRNSHNYSSHNYSGRSRSSGSGGRSYSGGGRSSGGSSGGGFR